MIYDLTKEAIPMVAQLMATIKPEFWDYNGAEEQLNSYGTTGWYISEYGKHIKGWMLVRGLESYSCLELDCFGYNENGKFVTEEQMKPLFKKAEEYALDKGYRIMRLTITSLGMSCDGRELDEYWKELKELKAIDRVHYYWLLQYGFKPSGFMPNCYGQNFHGIIMIKNISH